MKPTSRFISTSRGPIVDGPSLIKALRSHAIAGAAIDVFDEEPLPAQHPFRSMDNGWQLRISDTFWKASIEHFMKLSG
jgi:phosphoglycerate dehydrogenase-like enzyme